MAQLFIGKECITYLDYFYCKMVKVTSSNYNSYLCYFRDLNDSRPSNHVLLFSILNPHYPINTVSTHSFIENFVPVVTFQLVNILYTYTFFIKKYFYAGLFHSDR